MSEAAAPVPAQDIALRRQGQANRSAIFGLLYRCFRSATERYSCASCQWQPKTRHILAVENATGESPLASLLSLACRVSGRMQATG